MRVLSIILFSFVSAQAQSLSTGVLLSQRIEIFAYYYVDSHLNYKSMGFTQPNTVNHYEIWAKESVYWFRFNSEIFETLRVKNCVHGLRVRAFPYFGGNETAPHDMEIEILEY